jgi:hypothetical protein
MESSNLIKLFSRHVLKSLPMYYGIGMWQEVSKPQY